MPHRAAAVAFAAEDVEQHAVGNLEAGSQPLRRRGDQAGEGVFVPVDEVFLGRLALDGFPAVAGGFFGELEVLDGMFGRLRHDPAAVVESLAPGASADLVKIPRAEDDGLLPVELAQAREEHGADGDVDAHAEGVRPADDLEQALLGELLDQHAVLGEQTGVMQADAVFEPFFDFRAVWAAELEPFQRGGEGVLLFAGADIEAGEILRALGGLQLGEMDDINRRFAFGGEAFERLGQGQFGIGILQRHRTIRGRNADAGQAGQAGQCLLEKRGVAQGGGHEQEAGLGQSQQWHLPGHAAVAVGVVMELVHDDLLDVGLGAFAQGDVGQDFRGAAENGGVAVDGGVAGAEADVVRAELAAEGHEFLIDKGLDRAGVNGAAALGEGLEVERGGHERFARAGGRVEDDVFLLEQLEDGRFLRGIEPELPLLRVFEKPAQQLVIAGLPAPGHQIIKCFRHRTEIPPPRLFRTPGNPSKEKAPPASDPK